MLCKSYHRIKRENVGDKAPAITLLKHVSHYTKKQLNLTLKTFVAIFAKIKNGFYSLASNMECLQPMLVPINSLKFKTSKLTA